MTVVRLCPIDEPLLAALLGAAVTDAHADEVTPPLPSPCDQTSKDGWTPERMAWFTAFHRERRVGLAGPLGEATWAIIADDAPVGCVRLKVTEHPDVLETGIWLRRSARSRGVGTAAIRAVLDLAKGAGAQAVRADTAVTNHASQALLTRSGFRLSGPAPADGRIHAVVALAGSDQAPGGSSRSR